MSAPKSAPNPIARRRLAVTKLAIPQARRPAISGVRAITGRSYRSLEAFVSLRPTLIELSMLRVMVEDLAPLIGEGRANDVRARFEAGHFAAGLELVGEAASASRRNVTLQNKHEETRTLVRNILLARSGPLRRKVLACAREGRLSPNLDALRRAAETPTSIAKLLVGARDPLVTLESIVRLLERGWLLAAPLPRDGRTGTED